MKNTQRNLLEIVDVEAGWIAALPIPKAEAVPLFIEELRGKGYEVKDEIEETAGGHVIRYRPGHKHEQKEDKQMSTKMQDAIAKLRAEMKGHPNPYVAGLGEFLINHIEGNPQDAEKFLEQGKTYDGVWESMMEAVKQKEPYKGCVMFMPDEMCAVILQYFGIQGATVTLTTPTPERPSDDDLDVNLTDFL